MGGNARARACSGFEPLVCTIRRKTGRSLDSHLLTRPALQVSEAVQSGAVDGGAVRSAAPEPAQLVRLHVRRAPRVPGVFCGGAQGALEARERDRCVMATLARFTRALPRETDGRPTDAGCKWATSVWDVTSAREMARTSVR